jgi:hypothetical protein
MSIPTRMVKGLGCVMVLLLLASPLAAQIVDQLSAYTGPNGKGYLQPVADAVGADLNCGLFHSAYIPKMGLQVSFELPMMGVMFADEDRTFMATTESGFSPEQTVEVPTVVGSGETKTVTGAAGTSFIFPGGLDLNSFVLAVPQLRIGSYMGTEAVIRYIAFDVGDVELGKVSLYGFGLRHSISQYLGPDFPVDLAGGFFWQTFSLGENQAGGDLVSADALSFGVQASKRYTEGFLLIEPYSGLSLDTYSMEASYESDAAGEIQAIDLDFGSNTSVHFTLGLAFKLAFLSGHAEYNIANMNSFSLGLSFSN